MNQPMIFLHPKILGLIIVYGIALGIPLLLLYTYRMYRKGQKKRPPFTDNFLRSPGQSLQEQIQELSEELLICLNTMLILPVYVYSIFFLLSERCSLSSFIVGTVAVLGLITYFCMRLWKLLDRRRDYRLGYDGEVAVGQELNQLMLSGYRVYHDFLTDKFNIDHIVCGPSGVYAVETKARSKPVAKNNRASAKVTYDGKALHFPGYSDTAALEQADRQAKWLQRWLSNAVGEPVRVHPAVALPGWYVERRTPAGIPVLNPKQFLSFLDSRKGDSLPERMIRRITHQLEQKCRDTEPFTVRLEKGNG